MRLLAPDGAVAEAGVRDPFTGRTRTYRADRGGIYDVPDGVGRTLLASGDFTQSVDGSVHKPGVGFRCTACGFGSFFRTCSRCGAPCEKEVKS